MKVISTKKLSKSFGNVEAVKEVDLDISKGEVFGFLGPNGAGKSTTIRMLLGLLYPTSGEVTVLGRNPEKEAHQIMKQVGYVAGDVGLPNGYKVKHYFDLVVHLSGAKRSDRRRHRLVDRFKLDEERKIGKLSRGNRQKVAIIAAFLANPKLLVLDEPTSGLDPLLQIEFFELLSEFKGGGGTVFFSSHILSEVRRACDRVGIIKEGEIIAVEEVIHLFQKNVSVVEIKLAQKTKATALEKLSGVSEFNLKGQDLHFTYEGEVDRLVGALAKFKLKDLKIHEPDLEQIFLHYYQD